MKIYFLGHGLNNSEESVGSILMKSFSDSDFYRFRCLVAFASLSGINILSNVIEESKQHIKEFRTFIGIDQKGTSKEALQALLNLNIGTEIFYTFSHIIFHPKIYIFEGETKCRILLGSSNLTKPGLFQNIEASFVIDFVKADEDGENLLNEIYNYFSVFFDNKTKNLQILTQELIQELFENGIIPDEAERLKTQESKNTLKSEKDESIENLKILFPTIKIQRLPINILKVKSQKKEKTKVTAFDNYDSSIKGELLWKKSDLPESDAQYVTSGTNPTGCLRPTEPKPTYNFQKAYSEFTTFIDSEVKRHGYKMDVNYGGNSKISYKINGRNVLSLMNNLIIVHAPKGDEIFQGVTLHILKHHGLEFCCIKVSNDTLKNYFSIVSAYLKKYIPCNVVSVYRAGNANQKPILE